MSNEVTIHIIGESNADIYLSDTTLFQLDALIAAFEARWQNKTMDRAEMIAGSLAYWIDTEYTRLKTQDGDE